MVRLYPRRHTASSREDFSDFGTFLVVDLGSSFPLIVVSCWAQETLVLAKYSHLPLCIRMRGRSHSHEVQAKLAVSLGYLGACRTGMHEVSTSFF